MFTFLRMVAQNRALYERIRNAGGVQYPVGAFPMSPDDWKDHFGPRWPRLRDAKQRDDPSNSLTPGYNAFRGPEVHGPSCGRQVALKLAVLTPHPRAHDPRDAANLLS